MLTNVLYGFGILLCLAGMIYLGNEFGRYLSDWAKLACLALSIPMFACLGKYFEKIGW